MTLRGADGLRIFPNEMGASFFQSPFFAPEEEVILLLDLTSFDFDAGRVCSRTHYFRVQGNKSQAKAYRCCA